MSTCNVVDLGLIPGLGRSLEKEMATHSSIVVWRIPMDRGAWRAAIHGVVKSRTQLSDFTVEEFKKRKKKKTLIKKNGNSKHISI